MAATRRDDPLVSEARSRLQVLEYFGFDTQDVCGHMLSEPFMRIVLARIIYYIHKYERDPGRIIHHVLTEGVHEIFLPHRADCQRDLFTCILLAVMTIYDFLESPLPTEDCDEFDRIFSSEDDDSDGM